MLNTFTMNSFKLFCIVTFVFIFSSSSSANKSLDSAKTFYDKGNYSEALKIYEKQSVFFPTNLELNYNLGNCYFKIGNKGLAILHYEKALVIDPENEDVLFNLQLAQTQLTDKFDAIPVLNLNTFFTKINKVISYNFLGILSIIMLLIACAFVFFAKRKKIKTRFNQTWLLLIFALGSFLWAYLQKQQLQYEPHAIVMSYECSIVSAPTENAVLIFKLHEGTKLKILSKTSDWANVKAPDGTIGWVKKEDIQDI